jgi:nicotinamide riboside transporter PnuC
MKNQLYKMFKSKTWDIGWLVVGIATVLGATYISATGEDGVGVTTITSCVGGILGMIIVQLYANGKAKLGNGMGVIGAGFDTFNNFQFGAIGNVLVGVYCACLYAKSFFTTGKEIVVSKVTNMNLIISGIITVAGCLVIWQFGDTILPEDVPGWVVGLNVAIFIVQVISQYLMVEGKAISWIGWIIANVINIIIFLYTFLSGVSPEALVYFCMTVMYLLNSIKAAFLWYGFNEE